jgi:hypothetical protein
MFFSLTMAFILSSNGFSPLRIGQERDMDGPNDGTDAYHKHWTVETLFILTD